MSIGIFEIAPLVQGVLFERIGHGCSLAHDQQRQFWWEFGLGWGGQLIAMDD